MSENDKGKVVKEPFFILVRAESPEAAITVADEVGDEESPSHEVVKTEKTKFTGVVVMEKKPKTAEAAPKKEGDKPKEEAKAPAKGKKK